MTIAPSLLAFIVAASVLTVTPGTDTALILRTAAAGGGRSAVFAGTGICIGCLIWGGAVAIGLGALLAASPLAFAALSWIGAAYLTWIGAKMLLRPRRTLAGRDAGEPRETAAAALRRGLLTNLLNPKIGVFYVTFLPQFVPAGAEVAAFTFLLACIHIGLTLVWFALLIGATVPLGRLLARRGVMSALDRLTGGIFIAFGLRLALSRPG